LLLSLGIGSSYADFFNEQTKPNLFAPAASQNQDFLAVEDAFRINVITQDSSKLVLRFIAAEGYYLYRDQFVFEITPKNLSTNKINLPQGILKNDEFFGETEVYYGIIDVEVGLNNPDNLPLNLNIEYQGCAEQGLCYPPQSIDFTFGQESANSKDHPQDYLDNEPYLPPHQIIDLTTFALFFLGGLGLAFTPCVLPMLPIISALVLRQTQASIGRKLALALAYVIAMASCFALLGALMGFFGAKVNLQASLQSAWILVPFAALFVLLALAMLGKFELQLPQFMRNHLQQTSNKIQGGSLFGAIFLGAFSALLVSPCVSAPLAAGLLYISFSGDALGGGLRLLALGLGMGLPLVIFSIGGASLLPKSGIWMLGVRNFFAILLLGVAIWLLERIITPFLVLPLWLILALYTAYLLRLKEKLTWHKTQVMQMSAIALLLTYCVLAGIGIYQGGANPLKPWAGKPLIGQWQTFTSAASIKQNLATASRSHVPVIIDLYADWCVSCKIIERNVFANAQILPRLSNYRLLRFDITAANAEQKEFLSEYKLFGPPAILFFAPNGEREIMLDVIGEVNAAQFALRLDDFDLLITEF